MLLQPEYLIQTMFIFWLIEGHLFILLNTNERKTGTKGCLGEE